MAISRCGNPMPFSGIWRPATIAADCGPRIRPRARASTAGWTGRRRRSSPISSWGSSGATIARRNRSATGPRSAKSLARCAEHFRLLDEVLATRPFLAGDRFSLADIPAGTSLYRYFELDIERPTVPNVTAWYERLRERAAYREHVMIPFADLRGRLEP